MIREAPSSLGVLDSLKLTHQRLPSRLQHSLGLLFSLSLILLLLILCLEGLVNLLVPELLGLRDGSLLLGLLNYIIMS